MTINIEEGNIKQGLLGLVVVLIEIIKDSLEHQALRRMESGRLTKEEVERLGNALIDLDDALERIKNDNDIAATVKSIRGDLDKLVNNSIMEMRIQEDKMSYEQKVM